MRKFIFFFLEDHFYFDEAFSFFNVYALKIFDNNILLKVKWTNYTVSWNNIFNIYFYIRLRTAANGERRIGYVDIRNIDLTKSLSGRRAERSRFSLLEY